MPDDANPSPAEKPRPMRRTLLIAGLSCLSALLIAGGFFWIQRARRAELEKSAISACRAYVEMQTMYYRRDWIGDGKLVYAHPYVYLYLEFVRGDPPLQLIDNAFAEATAPKSHKPNYRFRDMETIAGQPINWAKDFALCAMPAEHGRTGWRVFIVKTDGKVWGKDLGWSEFVADFPADPDEEGWQRAE